MKNTRIWQKEVRIRNTVRVITHMLHGMIAQQLRSQLDSTKYKKLFLKSNCERLATDLLKVWRDILLDVFPEQWTVFSILSMMTGEENC